MCPNMPSSKKQQKLGYGAEGWNMSDKAWHADRKKIPAQWRSNERFRWYISYPSAVCGMEKIQVPLTWELNGLHKTKEKHTRAFTVETWNDPKHDSNLFPYCWHSRLVSCPALQLPNIRFYHPHHPKDFHIKQICNAEHVVSKKRQKCVKNCKYGLKMFDYSSHV